MATETRSERPKNSTPPRRTEFGRLLVYRCSDHSCGSWIFEPLVVSTHRGCPPGARCPSLFTHCHVGATDRRPTPVDVGPPYVFRWTSSPPLPVYPRPSSSRSPPELLSRFSPLVRSRGSGRPGETSTPHPSVDPVRTSPLHRSESRCSSTPEAHLLPVSSSPSLVLPSSVPCRTQPPSGPRASGYRPLPS